MATSPEVLTEPFAQIFTDRAEANWAFDLLRDTAKRLGIQGAYDPRFAITLARRSGRVGLHLNFGGWLVLGFHGPGLTPARVDLALLASLVSWDERFNFFSFARKEGEPEVRSYHLPLDLVRPMTSDLHSAYLATLDFIAPKFSTWQRASHWKQHNPEIAEALFKPEQREQLFAGALTEPELRYERHLTAFYQDISEERGEYEVELLEAEAKAEAEWVVKTRGGEEAGEEIQPEYLLERTTDMNLNQEAQDIVYDPQKRLAKPFSQIFVDREEAEWAFGFLRETFQWLGVTNADDPRIAITIPDSHRVMRLDFGNWAVLQFYSFKSLYRVGIALISNQVHIKEKFGTWGAFAQSKPEIRVHDLPIELVRPFNEEIRKIYEKTFTQIAARFRTWKVSNYRKFNRQEIVEAVFDPEKREKLFDKGLSKEIESLDEEELEESIDLTSPILHLEEIIPSSENMASTINEVISISQLAADTALDETELGRWIRAIERKGQAILYGPPGTGKTFVAEKLARHLIGGGDGLVELVQFHPAYAYEDFIQGIRPESKDDHLAYPMKPGRFLEFCEKAKNRQDTCVLIIDEINRANLSRVFGELMYLLEYRERAIPLAGGGAFQISANVRLIGTMNTADRSIALVDHALRRRFAFIALYPNFNLLRRYHEQRQTGFPVEKLVSLLQKLNHTIADRHYEVGITFFLRPTLADEIEDIWRMEIEPYLEEYFFDRADTVEEFRWEKVKELLK